MKQTPQLPPPGFDELSIEERIDYVQALWDHIAAEADAQPLHDWQAAILDERMEKHRQNPSAARPASEVLERLERTLSSET